jgi:hypothetical protein
LSWKILRRILKSSTGFIWFTSVLSWANPFFQAHLKDPAQQCLQILEDYENRLRIPKSLLRTLAIVESGRVLEKKTMMLPWPWTINVNGKGHVYATQKEAIQAARKFRRQGWTSIDVGCMQINLKHHPHAFCSLEEAFDPMSNIAYGASFLIKLKERFRNWKQAISHYHSATFDRGNAYADKVFNRWKTFNSTNPTALLCIKDQNSLQRLTESRRNKPKSFLHKKSHQTTTIHYIESKNQKESIISFVRERRRKYPITYVSVSKPLSVEEGKKFYPIQYFKTKLRFFSLKRKFQQTTRQ